MNSNDKDRMEVDTNEIENTNLPFFLLPTEIHQRVFSTVDDKGLASFAQTSRLGLFVSQNPMIWKDRIMNQFHLDQNKLNNIKQEGESYNELYVRLKRVSFLLFASTHDKVYDPLRYFNTHINKNIPNYFFKSITCINKFLRSKTIRGARYIVEVALSEAELSSHMKNGATLASIGEYVRCFYPDSITLNMRFRMPDGSKPKLIAVSYHEGKFLPQNGPSTLSFRL